MIEAAYRLAPLSISSFKTMQKACHIYFANKVLPNFINLDNMHSDDQAISQNTFTPIVVATIEENVNKEDRDIFQNFEISPKKDTQEYMCYVCGEKAGKHSYYGGQVDKQISKKSF